MAGSGGGRWNHAGRWRRNRVGGRRLVLATRGGSGDQLASGGRRNQWAAVLGWAARVFVGGCDRRNRQHGGGIRPRRPLATGGGRAEGGEGDWYLLQTVFKFRGLFCKKNITLRSGQLFPDGGSRTEEHELLVSTFGPVRPVEFEKVKRSRYTPLYPVRFLPLF